EDRGDGGGDNALVPAIGPGGADELVVDESRDVGGEAERDDVSRLTGVDSAALVAGRTVGLREANTLARGALLKRRDDRAVGVLRGRVGDERELGGGRGAARGGRVVARIGAAAAGGDRSRSGDCDQC